MFPPLGPKPTQTDRPEAARTRIGRQLDKRVHARPWLAPVVTTLAAWLVAFLVVTVLFTLFGEQLASLPLALRALVMSGVLVALMANLVMPIVSAAIARWLAASPQSRPRRRSPSTTGDSPAQAQRLALHDA